jgi:hypothetical protein
LDLHASNVRAERPRNRCPIVLLIDDPTPCINPLYYFASQVPKNAVDYHYKEQNGKWYYDSDDEYKFPISQTIDQEFVREFSQWVESTEVKGKTSVVPYPAGIGRVDRKLVGFPKESVADFVSAFRNKVAQKFDIGPELLTHTRALNLKTKKLSRISEHDWSQKQTSATLEKYIGFAFEILDKAGLAPTGVTSPCNFGLYVEGEYARAVLAAAKKVLGLKVVWYFLQVDSESLNVNHKVVCLDREAGEAVVSLVCSMNDPFWTSQMTDMEYGPWLREMLDPVLSADGKSGRIAELIKSGSCITIVTHWQSLYSNGSRSGLKGLNELVTRINTLVKDDVIWMRCTEIASYVACSETVQFRTRAISGNGLRIDITSPFPCKDFTFSFEIESAPARILLRKEGDERGVISPELRKSKDLGPNSWFSSDVPGGNSKVFVCLDELSRSDEKTITYGATRKTQKSIKKIEYSSSVSVMP